MAASLITLGILAIAYGAPCVTWPTHMRVEWLRCSDLPDTTVQRWGLIYVLIGFACLGIALLA